MHTEVANQKVKRLFVFDQLKSAIPYSCVALNDPKKYRIYSRVSWAGFKWLPGRCTSDLLDDRWF